MPYIKMTFNQFWKENPAFVTIQIISSIFLMEVTEKKMPAYILHLV